VAHAEPDLPALDVILAATTLVVLASVVLHGASAHALTQRFSGGDG
jgi:NhaP-type Na+/H+ or K+/H+ antiporter